MVMNRPDNGEYAESYQAYVDLVPERDVLAVLAAQGDELRTLLSRVPRERETFRYRPGKWSIREVVGHIGDGERVFGYRAFCISRGDQASLPGFDENDYVDASGYDRRPLGGLLEVFESLRAANLAELSAIDADVWNRVGLANDTPVSVRALAFMLAGHVRHHMAILTNRYEVPR